jgi:hypothetical protein
MAAVCSFAAVSMAEQIATNYRKSPFSERRPSLVICIAASICFYCRFYCRMPGMSPALVSLKKRTLPRWPQRALESRSHWGTRTGNKSPVDSSRDMKTPRTCGSESTRRECVWAVMMNLEDSESKGTLTKCPPKCPPWSWKRLRLFERLARGSDIPIVVNARRDIYLLHIGVPESCFEQLYGG